MGSNLGMTPERWQRIKSLFDQALPLSAAERVALLEHSTESDRETVQEVMRLLARSESAGSFLEQPVGNAHKILSDAAQESQPSLVAGQRLGGRFVIERFIAHGGMGEVYRAFDTELAIPVAIKTLRREFARDAAFVDRFRREVQTAREVYGDHLCRIFDIGRDGEGEAAIVYISMEFLDGPTLRDVIKHEAPLSIDAALPVLRNIASGLRSLQHRGMVHRDLKPGNIVLVGWQTPEQRAVITDFGLARNSLVSRQGGEEAQTTRTSHSGRIAGTPDYMAPEQLNGKPVSAATDLYAFGIVAYEMVTGKRPFDSDGWESAFLRLTEEPESPRSHSASLPAIWERAILRCLAREPEQRPASAWLVTEVLAGEQPVSALRTGAVRRAANGVAPWKMAVAAIALLAAIGLGWMIASQRWFFASPPSSTTEPGKHVAVLPFSFSETDPELRPYADGLMDTITSRLSQFEQENAQLLVVPSGEVRSLRVQSPADALRRFRADYAIEGRVDSQQDRVRLTLTVVDTATMRQREAAVIEEPRDRLLNLQDGAISRLSNALNLRIASTRDADPSTSLRISPAAYDFYLQGRGYLQRNDRLEDVRNAATLFERALALDPAYAPALAGLADAQWFLYERSRDPKWVKLAEQSAESALKANPQLPDARITKGLIQNGTGAYKLAIRSFEEALALDKRNPEALYGLGAAYANLGQMTEAESTYLRAVSLRPSDWRAHKKLGVFYLTYGLYEKAVKPLQYVVDLTPDNAQGYNNLGVAWMRLGRYDQARRNLQRTIDLDPRVSAITNMSYMEFHAGNYKEAVAWNRKALVMDEKSYRVWGNLGAAYERLLQTEEMAAAYRKALALVGDEMKVNPQSGDLHSYQAHFQAPLGMRAEAIANMRTAEELEPSNPGLWHRNAETWISLGDEQSALRALRSAVRNGLRLDTLAPNSRLLPLRNRL
ncbi:MAG: protein kinase [Bryobacterales bacterium]|nr:protein kinase [Bryobacterales bacterium]